MGDGRGYFRVGVRGKEVLRGGLEHGLHMTLDIGPPTFIPDHSVAEVPYLGGTCHRQVRVEPRVRMGSRGTCGYRSRSRQGKVPRFRRQVKKSNLRDWR